MSYDALIALPNPQVGDIAYDLTFDCLRLYNGSKWVCSFQNPSDNIPNITAIATAGSVNLDYGNSIATDTSGNYYITGHFAGTATFGDQSRTSAGGRDIFVTKYNSSGVVQWVRAAGGTGEDNGYGIATDASGNVYVTGSFSGTAAFGNQSRTAVGGSDIFLAKYNSSGALQWVRAEGGTGEDIGVNVVADASGVLYTTGVFFGTATFGTESRTSAGDLDIFVAKYNDSGTLQWVRAEGGATIDYGIGIAIDASGNVYTTGHFSGTATFGTTTKTSEGGYDVFVVKYNGSGALQWVVTRGNETNDFARNITTDSNGNTVCIIGFFEGTAVFGYQLITSVGVRDVFVIKYNTSDGTMQWARTAGGVGDDQGYGITNDASGNVYVTGAFYDTIAFGNVSVTAAGFSDVFVAKYSSSGTLQWIQTAGGTNIDAGDDIVVDAKGNIYAVGNFSGTATFGSQSKTSVGSQDIFVIRLQQ